MQPRVRKAVFPVAGLGSRFLPATKAMPKEMLPIVDKPLIQYAVEEAIEAGIDQLIFVTGRTKRAIEDHFDTAYELESELAARGKNDLLELARSVLPPHVSCAYVRQNEALGLGHAVLCAAPLVGREPFAVLLADDLIDALPGRVGCLAQMVEAFDAHQTSVLAVENVPRSDTGRYGIVDSTPLQAGSATELASRLEAIRAIIEKPTPLLAPSTLAVTGRYILTAAIFDELRCVPRGAGGEIQLTDGIAQLLAKEQVLALRYSGTRYDCGDKLDYVMAVIAFAKKHAGIGEQVRARLAALD
jgi:UTP--glucose-1-phosphate uridylyltransferase